MWVGLLKASFILISYYSFCVLLSFSFNLTRWMLTAAGTWTNVWCVAASRDTPSAWRSALIASAGGLVHQSLHREADFSQALALQDVMRKTQFVLEGHSHREGGVDENHVNRKRIKGQEEKMMIKWFTYTCIKTEKCTRNTRQQGQTENRGKDTYITYANASETVGPECCRQRQWEWSSNSMYESTFGQIS